MLGRQRGYHQPRVTMLAGWLFADLFLALFLAALSAQSPGSLAWGRAAEKRIRLKRATRGDCIRRARRPLKPVPLGSLEHYHRFCGIPQLSGQPLLSDFDDQLRAHPRMGRRAGFIQVFATGADLSEAVQVATAAIAEVRAKDADRAAFTGAISQPLWGGESNGCGSANFHIQILFTNELPDGIFHRGWDGIRRLQPGCRCARFAANRCARSVRQRELSEALQNLAKDLPNPKPPGSGPMRPVRRIFDRRSRP